MAGGAGERCLKHKSSIISLYKQLQKAGLILNYCKDIIEYIKNVKANFNNNLYRSNRELESDFNAINELTGINAKDIKNKNLNDVFAVQEFLIDEVCKIHESENDSDNAEIFRNNINIKELHEKLNDGKRACDIYSFNGEGYEYFLIGDLHSDTVSLKRILHICNFFSDASARKKKRFIFLGDYVDRGKEHIKMLEYILALKYIFPEYVYLLKGNHDDGILVKEEIKLCIRKPEDESDDDYFLLYLNNLLKSDDTLRLQVIRSYLKFFDSLCNIAFVSSQKVSLMVVHGGIPRPEKEGLKHYDYINSLSDLTDTQITDNLNRTIVNNMLWSDPCSSEDDLRENSGRFRFSEEQFDEFQSKIKFDLLIRGHEAELEGYRKFFGGRLCTIFSSGAVLENNININNETAYNFVAPKIIKFSAGGQVSLIGLN